MNRNAKRLFALFLALAMTLALGACGESGDKEGNRLTPIVKSPEDDPAGYLAMAMENTGKEVLARYEGSPLLAIGGALGSRGAFTVSGRLDTQELSGDLRALKLVYDLEDREFLLTLDGTVGTEELRAGVCLSRDFVGVSAPSVLPDGDYYGIVPHDLASQLKKSPLIDWLGGTFDPDDPALAELDELLTTLWEAKPMDLDGAIHDLQKLSLDYIMGLPVEYSAGSVTVDGKETDGYIFTAAVTGEDLKGLLDEVYDRILAAPVWETLAKLGGIGGEPVSQDSLRAMLDESLDEMDLAGVAADVTYTVADGKVITAETVTEYQGQSMAVSIDYFDGGVLTVSTDVGGETVTLTSVVTQEDGAYRHELTVSAQGQTMALRASRDSETLTADVSLPDGSSASAVMDLSVTGGGFTVKNLRLTGEDGEIEVPLTFAYTSDEFVSMPENTKNILKMSEDELTETFGVLFNTMGGVSDPFPGGYDDGLIW